MQDSENKVVVCDKQGNIVCSKLRKDVDRINDCLKTINIFLISNKKVFITLPRQSAWPGKWASSAAGMVKFGETSEEAAIRTAKRELGVNDITFLWESYYEFQEVKRFISFFYSEVDSKIIKGNYDDVSETKWVDLNEIMKIIKDDKFIPTFLVGLDVIKNKLI